eukprot:15341814-Ditylum_brightwellii.AAC.1
MDANGEIGDAKLGNLLGSTRLIDTIGATHGMNSPPTYIWGKATIDFIFATPGVLKAIQRCIITVHQARRVGLKQPARSENVREEATSNICSKEIAQQLTVLDDEYNKTVQLNEQQYKNIDQDLHEPVMDAVNSLPKVPKAWWTPERGHKFTLLQYWRAKLSFRQINMLQ